MIREDTRTEVVAFRLTPAQLTALLLLAREWGVEDGAGRTSLTVRNLIERVLLLNTKVPK